VLLPLPRTGECGRPQALSILQGKVESARAGVQDGQIQYQFAHRLFMICACQDHTP